MQTSIDFSVIIPTFRRPGELRHAILSALEQTGVQVEILVVDDSPERSAETVVTNLQDSRVTYLINPQPSGGYPSRVRNLAWPNAKGSFIHFLDDDDIIPQGHYAAVKAAFSKQSDVGVVFCRIEPFGNCSTEQLQLEKEYFAEAHRLATICQRLGPKTAFVACLMFQWAIMVCSAGIVRRDCLVRLGGFDPEIRLREDVDFYARAMRHFGVFFLDKVGLLYRIGSPSLMHDPNTTKLDLAQLREAQLRTNTKYQREWGIFEFYALKLFARTVLKIL
jgi:glycosyltransferase involved in cell wall biosynthesis